MRVGELESALRQLRVEPLVQVEARRPVVWRFHPHTHGEGDVAGVEAGQRNEWVGSAARFGVERAAVLLDNVDGCGGKLIDI